MFETRRSELQQWCSNKELIVRWTRLVSWVKATGLRDSYSKLKTRHLQWCPQEASSPHQPAGSGLTTCYLYGAMML